MPHRANFEDEFGILSMENDLEEARTGIIPFTEFTKSDYRTNWHHSLVAEYIEKWIAKKIKRLMIFEPPRHGKSEQVSRRAPAYIFGINPDAEYMGTTYGATLASDNNRDVQRILDSPEYLELFPETRLSTKSDKTIGTWLKNSETFHIVNKRGVYRCAGIGGGITGKGMHYGVIDDWYKNAEEAESETIRNKVYDWYTQVFYTRLEKDACILINGTRWHQDGLPGRLLDEAKSDPKVDQWTVLRLPALMTDEEFQIKHPRDPRNPGEALWPEKYSAERLISIKATIGSRKFEAMFQQNPSMREGNIIKRNWLRFYRRIPHRFDQIIQSWDLSFDDKEGSSFVVGQVWGRLGALIYLLDEVRDRMNFPSQIAAVKALSAKWPKAYAKVVEEKANGAALIAALRGKVAGLVPYNPKTSKDARLEAVSPFFESGDVMIPDPSIATWINDWVEEVCGFPHKKYTDRADATSMALIYYQGEPSGDFDEKMTERRSGTIAGSMGGDDRW